MLTSSGVSMLKFYKGRGPTIHMLLSPSEGGGPLSSCYSVLVSEEARYLHATQS